MKPYISQVLLALIAAVACVQAHAASVGEAEVRQCARELFQRVANGGCSGFFSLETVRRVDGRESGSDANIIADLEFRVKQRVGGNSPAATQCTGNAWKVEVKNPYPPNTGQWLMFQSQADMDGGYLEPNRGLRVRKNFKFEKWESGWRCAEQSMSPLMLVWDNIMSSTREIPAAESIRALSNEQLCVWAARSGTAAASQAAAELIGRGHKCKPI